jgi:hypothetical protein
VALVIDVKVGPPHENAMHAIVRKPSRKNAPYFMTSILPTASGTRSAWLEVDLFTLQVIGLTAGSSTAHPAKRTDIRSA